MTMLSFRVSDDEAARLQRWAEELGVERSKLLRDALGRYLADLAADADAGAWEGLPLTADEKGIAEVAHWGPAEDWSDWANA